MGLGAGEGGGRGVCVGELVGEGLGGGGAERVSIARRFVSAVEHAWD